MKVAGLLFGALLALVDVISLPIIKSIQTGEKNFNYIFITMVLYSLIPIFFYLGLNYSSMTTLNLTWDLWSDIMVTFIGLFILKEHIGTKSYIGLIFAFIAIILFLSDEK